MFFGPAAVSGKAPPVDNITVEDQFLTVAMFEEVVYLVDLAVERSQMHVGEEDRFVRKSCFFHDQLVFFNNYRSLDCVKGIPFGEMYLTWV